MTLDRIRVRLPRLAATIVVLAAMSLSTPVMPAMAQGTAMPAVKIDARVIEGKALPSGGTAFLGVPYATPRSCFWQPGFSSRRLDGAGAAKP